MSKDNPYSASRHYKPRSVWADEFWRGDRPVWHIFDGDKLVARVENKQQALNVMNLVRQLADEMPALPGDPATGE